MASYQRVEIDGQIKMIPSDPPEPPKNPDLTALNAAAKADAAAMRDENTDVLRAIGGAAEQVLTGRGIRRAQKPLRPTGKF